jgi:hypothetical protein
MLRAALFLATGWVLSTSATFAEHPPRLKSTDRIFDGGYGIDGLDSNIIVDGPEATQRLAEVLDGLYTSSVVGTDFDFITEDDPNTFQRLEYVGFIPFEMPDKRSNPGPLVQDAYVFNAYFSDGTLVGIAMDKDFGSRAVAEQDVLRYMPRIGKLPTLYRKNIKHVVVHTGGVDTTAFSEDKGHFFVIYADNATKRIGTHDLEETFFHEASHASIQDYYLTSDAWQEAKALDNAYVTDYAKTSDQEDFAETALFAYTLIYHPERIPAVERAKIMQRIPNRLAFFRTVFTD